MSFAFSKIETSVREGKVQKTPILKKWKHLTLENVCDAALTGAEEGLAIVTGKVSGLTVLDFDDKAVLETFLTDHPEMRTVYRVDTYKGAHLYFLYDERMRTGTNCLQGYASVDVRNDDAILFAPPTTYKLPDGTVVKYTYMGGYMEALPVWLIADQTKPNKTVRPTVQVGRVVKQDVLVPNEDVEYMLNNHLLDQLAFEGWDAYNKVGLCMRFHTTKEHYERFARINTGKYSKEEVDTHWNSFKINYVKCDINRLAEYVRETHPDYMLLEEQKFHEEYQLAKAQFELDYVKIVNHSAYLRISDMNLLSPTDLCIGFSHLKLSDGNPFVQVWLADPNIRVYTQMECAPPPLMIRPPKSIRGKMPVTTFNTWQPYELFETMHEASGTPDLFLNHIKHMCGNEDHVYMYFLKFVAHMLQKPGKKCGVFPLFYGSQGCGKGALADILKLLVGESKYYETSSPEEHVWGPFNAIISGKVLVNLNEITSKSIVSAYDRIKSLITDANITYNQKCVKAYTSKSFHRFIAFTNNVSQYADKDSRRQFFIECADTFKKNKPYFDRLYQEMDRPGAIQSLFNHLVNMDITGFESEPIPITNYAADLLESSESMYLRGLRVYLAEYCAANPDCRQETVNWDHVYKSFCDFWRHQGNREENCPAKHQMKLQMSKLRELKPYVVHKRTKACNTILLDMPLAHFFLQTGTHGSNAEECLNQLKRKSREP